ncbi:putative endonuclease lcl3 [Ptychographa xylographoides]|nr:putative endonuclease lcl3 [Ptychographa xylographoides]
MRWPPWSSPPDNDIERAKKAAVSSWSSPILPTDWSHYASPEVLIPTAILTSTILVSTRLYRSYLRRIPGATRISTSFWRKRSLFGTVTSVGDGDGFRLFHTPGGRLAGWGWAPNRTIPKGKALKDNTISIRLAGIDAPELSHFGRPAQPGAQEALDWLTLYVHHRRVRAYIYKKDQYDRAVATAYVRRGLLRRDVGLQMLKKGLATVYEAKSGAEFGDLEEKYRSAEEKAKRKGLGIWRVKKGFESPRDYKTRMGQTDAGGNT